MSSSDDDSPRASRVSARPPPVLDNKDLPALFWDEMPENAEEHPDMVALQALIDESSPEERAGNFKEQGNQALKTGLAQKKKFYIREAIKQYTQGLELPNMKDEDLAATLLSNRAQANLLLGNHRRALEDALWSLRRRPGDAKASFRAAKAALALGEWDEAVRLSTEGATCAGADAAAFRKTLVAAQAGRERASRREAEERAAAERARLPARTLAKAILSRGWRVGRPQFSLGDRKPAFEDGDRAEGEAGAEKGASSRIEFPAIVFYPEASMQQDQLQRVGEDDAIADHLDAMFGPDAPPLEWDAAGNYSRDRVRLYYLSNAAKPLDEDALTESLYGGWPAGDRDEERPSRYGDKAATWTLVDERKTLGDVLREPGCVVPGIPVFFALSEGSEYQQKFLQGDIPLLG